MMISRYQKMISQGIISDILISAGGEQLEHRKLAHDKQPTSCRLYCNIAQIFKTWWYYNKFDQKMLRFMFKNI